MATRSIYYLNDLTFTDATAVYADAGLITLAADGYYSFNGLVRQQIAGVLMPYVKCESCSGGYVYSVTRCADGLELIVSSGTELVQGSLIMVTNYDGCQFEVGLASELEPTQEYITTLDATCEDHCSEFKLINTSDIEVGVEYTDCAAVPQGVLINGLSELIVCAKNGSIFAPETITVTLNNCQCS